MRLTEKQRKRFNKIRRNKGAEAAKEYRAGILGTTRAQPEATNAGVDFTNPNSVVQAQREENTRAQIASAPNVEGPGGRRDVITNPDGSSTIRTTLDAPEQGLYTASLEAQGVRNALGNKYADQAFEQGEFNPQTSAMPNALRTGSIKPPQTFDGRVEDPRRTNIQAPGSFRDMQEQVYNNALASYTQSTNDDYAFRRNQLEQQLANEGIVRGNEKYDRAMKGLDDQRNSQLEQVKRNAYRDSHEVGSNAFRNQLTAQGAEFEQGLLTNEQGLKAEDMRFAHGMGAANFGLREQDQAFNEGMRRRDTEYSEAYTNYMMPHTMTSNYMPNMGAFNMPNFGPVTSMPTSPVNVGNLGLGYGELGFKNDQLRAQGGQFERDLESRMEIARMNNATSRANAGASRTPLSEKLALIEAENAGRMDQIYATSALANSNLAGF